ncbi:MAG: hypothetical protein E7129_04330 [Rikenellaceae bacterium]|nr:hypothetical protein [Rikenellaceae bacterium]
MEMKKMPYKVEEGAIEHAKYLAKMAVREAAHPTERHSHKVQWRWASAVAVAAVIVVGVIGFVKYYDDIFRPMSPMEELIAEMKSASDEIIYDLSVDSGYYLEEENQL